MPPEQKPECHICHITFSVTWRKNDKGQDVCNSCSVRPQSSHSRRSSCPFNLRKSTRSKNSRKNVKALQSIKGKGRRAIFKQTRPVKSFLSTSFYTPTECVFHKTRFFQGGDIVSLIGDDEKVYYAQINRLVISDLGDKFAYIQWLLPTNLSANKPFDPSTYYLGPTDTNLKKLEDLTVICNAPVNYYQPTTAPFDVVASKKESGFIWSDISSQFTSFTPVKTEKVETEKIKTEKVEMESPVCSTASETDVTSEA